MSDFADSLRKFAPKMDAPAIGQARPMTVAPVMPIPDFSTLPSPSVRPATPLTPDQQMAMGVATREEPVVPDLTPEQKYAYDLSQLDTNDPDKIALLTVSRQRDNASPLRLWPSASIPWAMS